MSDQIETKRCGAVPKRCSGSDGSNDEEPPRKRSLENGALHPSAQSVSNEPEVVNGSICPKVSDSTFATGNRNASIAKTKRTDKLSLLSQTFKPTMLGSRGSKTFSKRTDKKNTILEQSKHDWESFKSCEGLNEELKTYNRGKNGYIERQEFLQRTDQRQFEIERHLRSKQK